MVALVDCWYSVMEEEGGRVTGPLLESPAARSLGDLREVLRSTGREG